LYSKLNHRAQFPKGHIARGLIDLSHPICWLAAEPLLNSAAVAEGRSAMADMLDLLRRRRSVAPHLLGGPAPQPGEIDEILTLAARVPDHGRLVPWRFIVLHGGARMAIGEVIAAAYRADNPGADEARLGLERTRLARAPLVIAVVSSVRPHAKIPDWEQTLSAGAACMNLVLAANAKGYATSWLTEWYAYDRRVLDALGLSPHERIAAFVHIGRPMEAPVERERPALAKIVTRFSG
jgi:nitroreductase